MFLTYHTLALFAVLLTALPLILRVPTGDSYRLALGVAVLLSFPTLASTVRLHRWWRKLAVVGLMAALATGGWFARLWVPPATLWLTDRRGRQYGVPVDKLAYVEIGSSEASRRIGFGG